MDEAKQEGQRDDAESRLQKLEKELEAVDKEYNDQPIEWTMDMALQAIKNLTETVRRLVKRNAEAEARIREMKKDRVLEAEHSEALFHARNAALEMLLSMAETSDLIKAINGVEAKYISMGDAIHRVIEKLRDNEIPEWLINAMARREEEDANLDEA